MNIFAKKFTNFIKDNFKLFFIFTIFFILRILYLESDLPFFNITQIFFVDEGYYTIPAFNLYHYGEMSHQIFNYIPDDGSPANVFQNIITWFSLEIFGNTYYGLRMASVFISMIVLILFYLLAKQLLKQQEFKYKNHLILGTTIYLGIDFEFLVLSRVAEPTIFRTFSMMFLIYLFYLREKNNKIDSKLWTFFIGLFATFSVFFVYFYNLFILAGCWLAIILFFFVKKEKKKAVIHTVIYGLGFISGVLLFELFLRVVYNQNLIEYFQSMQMYSSRLSYSNGFIGFIKNIFINLFNMFGTNIFRFNISFLFIFLFFILIFIYKLKKEKKYFDFIIFSIVFMHILQILFENSYFYRRLTILLPLILLLILLSADYLTIFIENFKKNLYFKTYIIFIILFSLIIFYVFNISNYGMGSLNSELPFKLPLFFLIINAITIMFIIKKRIVYLLVLPLFLMNIYYLYSNPEFKNMSVMKQSDKVEFNSYTSGILSFSLRLYNNTIPVLNFYKYEFSILSYNKMLNELFEATELYLFDYDDSQKNIYERIRISNENYYFIPNDFYFIGGFVITIYKKISKFYSKDKEILDMKNKCKKLILDNIYYESSDKSVSIEEHYEIYDKYMNIFFYDKKMKKKLMDCIGNL